MTIILGADEAGRGPVIGPLVMAGVTIKKEEEIKLKNIGVKDSKLLTPKQREELFEKIVNIVQKYKIIIISAKEIDNALLSEEINLNWLEAIKSAEIINGLKPDTAYLDCPSNNIKAYSDYVRKLLENKDTKIIAEHKADMTYPVVSAASILAKVTRDKEIEKIKKKVKVDFGSGYPSDPVTQEFLEKNYNKFPEIFRKTWESYKRIVRNKGQAKLGDF